MKITAAGTINRDVKQFADGRKEESLGGLLFTILTLAGLAEDDDLITPVAHVGYDIHDSVLTNLKKFTNINPDGLMKADTLNNTVYLELSPNTERDEHTDLNLPPLKFIDLEKHLNCDVLIMNFTSGYDFEPADLMKIKTKCKGLIYIDIHSLTLGIDESGHRFRRKIPQWRNLIRGADIVQLTAGEAWSFAEDDAEYSAYEVAFSIAEEVSTACLMTKGAEGVTAYMTGGGYQHFPAVKAEKIIDTTGCGDVFGAAFLINYMRSKDLEASIEFGNRMAAEKCAFSGLDFFHNNKI
ncbi:hypothetical protein ISS30_04365 [bacterium]|nr:hypothetical protein [bacterium]